MCDCIPRVNELLAEHNTVLNVPMIGPKVALIETRKLDTKNRVKPSAMFASFCPFCGEKYPEKTHKESQP